MCTLILTVLLAAGGSIEHRIAGIPCTPTPQVQHWTPDAKLVISITDVLVAQEQEG